MSSFDVNAFRESFPILNQYVNNKKLVYFDNAATTQKMASTIEAQHHFYQTINANVHRGSHALGESATRQFEQARINVKQLLNAQSTKEVIWTKGATEAINLVANSWGRTALSKGDEILLSYSEHHANIVPWQMIADQTGAIIKVIALADDGRIDINHAKTMITEKTRIVAVNHISNVLGKVNDVSALITLAKSVGACTLIDGSQAIAHITVNVQALDCDFYVFSAHKFYGPTGLGVLYGKEQLLEKMPPYQSGGEMIKKVSFSGTSFNQLPFKFEAGTPNIAGVIAFSTALTSFQAFQVAELKAYESQLTDYTYQQLSNIPELSWLVIGKPDVGIFSFVIKGHHHQDLAAELDLLGVAVRSGDHCAMPLMAYQQCEGCLRLSLAPYNTYAEVDYVIAALKHILAGNQQETEKYKLNESKRALKTTVLAPTDEVKVFEANHDQKSHREGTYNESKTSENDDLITSITAEFKQATSWDSRHRIVMLYSKMLMRLAKEERSNELLIQGCESKAWLAYRINNEGNFTFSADSDAKVIRGLLYLVLAVYQNQSAQYILNFDIEAYFAELGLLRHLSPSRGNGLLAIVARIQAIAKAH